MYFASSLAVAATLAVNYGVGVHAGLIRAEQTGSSIKTTCRSYTLGGNGKVGQTTIEGRCYDDAGKLWMTSLNLNNCIGNNQGTLINMDQGNFDSTCRPCTIDDKVDGADIKLKCNCLPKPNAVPKYTDIDLGSTGVGELAVRLINGQFVCGNNKGTKV